MLRKFLILESNIYFSLVAQKMGGEGKDLELDNKINAFITFIKSIKGLSFEYGTLKVSDEITKKEVIQKYINKFQ